MKTNQSLTTTNFIGYAQEEYENLKPLIEITKAFVRSSNQYIYIIDFLKKDFLYVSDKIVRLCGEEIDGKKRFNYEIYLKTCPNRRTKDAFGNQRKRPWFVPHIPYQRTDKLHTML